LVKATKMVGTAGISVGRCLDNLEHFGKGWIPGPRIRHADQAAARGAGRQHGARSCRSCDTRAAPPGSSDTRPADTSPPVRPRRGPAGPRRPVPSGRRQNWRGSGGALGNAGGAAGVDDQCQVFGRVRYPPRGNRLGAATTSSNIRWPGAWLSALGNLAQQASQKSFQPGR
jgi:hypothetical protein